MSRTKRYRLHLQEGSLVKQEEQQELLKDESNRKFFRTVGMASELGFVLAFPLVGGIFLGIFLDNKFSSNPRLTLVFLFIGIFISFSNLYGIMKEYLKKDK